MGATHHNRRQGLSPVPSLLRSQTRLSPDRDLKIRRALERAVRKIKLRLLIQRELLRVQVFLMNARCALAYARGYLVGLLD